MKTLARQRIKFELVPSRMMRWGCMDCKHRFQHRMDRHPGECPACASRRLWDSNVVDPRDKSDAVLREIYERVECATPIAGRVIRTRFLKFSNSL